MSLLSNVIRPIRGLWLPPSAEPAFFCVACPETFMADEREKYLAHVVTCAEEHVDELVAADPRHQAPGFWSAADPEYEEWIKSPAGREWFDRASTTR